MIVRRRGERGSSRAFMQRDEALAKMSEDADGDRWGRRTCTILRLADKFIPQATILVLHRQRDKPHINARRQRAGSLECDIAQYVPRMIGVKSKNDPSNGNEVGKKHVIIVPETILKSGLRNVPDLVRNNLKRQKTVAQ